MRSRTLEGYQRSLERAKLLRSRDQPTAQDLSELQSWHITRLHTTNQHRVDEVKESRVLIGEGAFGKVYKTVERSSGCLLAVKLVGIAGSTNPDLLRAAIHKEIKVMEKLRHVGSPNFYTSAYHYGPTPTMGLSHSQSYLHTLMPS